TVAHPFSAISPVRSYQSHLALRENRAAILPRTGAGPLPGGRRGSRAAGGAPTTVRAGSVDLRTRGDADGSVVSDLQDRQLRRGAALFRTRVAGAGTVALARRRTVVGGG